MSVFNKNNSFRALLINLLCTLNTFAAGDELYNLGQSLFFDKILSGNQNISCASCHHPMTGTSDSLALGLGEGAVGVGMGRRIVSKVHERVPRNSPALWNINHPERVTLFHDGRMKANMSEVSGYENPEGTKLPKGFRSTAAAQAVFPITSAVEMAGQKNENPIGRQASLSNISGGSGVWDLTVKKLQLQPKYVEAFKVAFNDIESAGDINITHVGNALAHFEGIAFKALNSPYDQFEQGDESAISLRSKNGLALFKGKANCINCHSGTLFTDQKFYSLGFPQIGGGKGHGKNGKEDFGREGVTKNKSDRYKFITPTLRNIQLTAPYGHSGVFNTLEQVVRAHFMKDGGISLVRLNNLRLPLVSGIGSDFVVFGNLKLKRRIYTSRIDAVPELSDVEVNELVAFLESLTDSASVDLSRVIPKRVYSGLPIE